MEGAVKEPTASDLERLESRAQAIQKGRSATANPVVLEFAGSPKAGKTTVIEVLNHFFRRMDFKVWAPSEGASKRTPYHLRRSRDWVAFNTWSLSYAISELLVAYHNVDRQDVIVLDRGPFDAVAWMRHLKGKGDLLADEHKVIEEFALLPRWSRLVSRVYVFSCDPQTSLSRETEGKLTAKPGNAMNSDTLGAIRQEYKSLAAELREASIMLQEFDTTDGPSARAIAYAIADETLSLLEQGRV